MNNRLCLSWFLPILLLQGSTLFTPSAAEAKEKVLRDELWGIELRVEKGKIWRDHPLSGRSNFVFALQSKHGGCELNVSLFAIAHPEEDGPSSCRDGYAGNPRRLAQAPGVTIHEQAAVPVAYTLYDQGTLVLTQNQLYGYWTRRDTCFELHVSSLNCAAFRDLAMPILESVRLSDDTGVSLETVEIASRSGADPRDWKVHLTVASVYLYQASPPVPERARRFYHSALEAAAGQLDPRTEWTLQEGIGLSWLTEDDGGNAISALVRALELARSHLSGAALESTLHNLACAYSLAERNADACGAVEALLSGAEGENRKRLWQEIEADPQLAGAREAECYRQLISKLEISA